MILSPFLPHLLTHFFFFLSPFVLSSLHYWFYILFLPFRVPSSVVAPSLPHSFFLPSSYSHFFFLSSFFPFSITFFLSTESIPFAYLTSIFFSSSFIVSSPSLFSFHLSRRYIPLLSLFIPLPLSLPFHNPHSLRPIPQDPHRTTLGTERSLITHNIPHSFQPIARPFADRPRSPLLPFYESTMEIREWDEAFTYAAASPQRSLCSPMRSECQTR